MGSMNLMDKFGKFIGALSILGALLWTPRMSIFIQKSFNTYAQPGREGTQFQKIILLIHMVFPVIFLSGILIGGTLVMLQHKKGYYLIVISFLGMMIEEFFFG